MPGNRKVAIVTGGRRGIGLGIARCLAHDGCDIVIADIVPPEEADDAARELEALGANVLYQQADVTSAEARAELVEAVQARFGRLDVLVNNAGVAPKVRADVLEATEQSYDLVMGVNLRGPYFLTQLVAKWMIEQREADADFTGCIVNISSISATVASVSRGDYCISKAGVSMATKLWAVRLAEYGIGVYEIRPGIIRTDMTAAVRGKYDKLIADGLLPQARWGEPEDVGKVVAALVRGDLAYCTGQVIHVDGGMQIQRL